MEIVSTEEQQPPVVSHQKRNLVVLELDPSHVEIGKVVVPPKEKTPAELIEDEKKGNEAFGSFLGGMVESHSRENRKEGGDGNVTGIVVS